MIITANPLTLVSLANLADQTRMVLATLAPREAYEVEDALLDGRLDLLYVAPERMMRPGFIHSLESIPLALIAAIIGGALWGAIAGFLKARTGAHEVITTIMLNFIALFLVDYLLQSSLFQQAGRNDPISQPANASTT